jgi:integrase
VRQRGTLRLDHRTWRLKLRRTDGEGQTRRIWVRIGTIDELRTRAAARQAADRYLDNIDPRELHAGTPIEWNEWVDRYLLDHLSKKAKGTVATQTSIIESHLRGAFSGPVHKIDRFAAQAFINREQQAGAAPATVGARFAVLRRMLMVAKREGLAATPPTLAECEIPTNPKVTAAVRQKAFSDAECLRIIGAATVRDAAAYALAYRLGLRASEVLGLEWPVVDLERGLVDVRQQALDGEIRPLKTKGSAAVLAAPPGLLDQLTAYRETFDACDTGYLFRDATGRPETAQALRERLHALLIGLGLRKRGLHGFRHACALAMADAGCNPEAIRRAMRHSSLRITAIYLSAAPEDIAAAFRRAETRGRFGAGSDAATASIPASGV